MEPKNKINEEEGKNINKKVKKHKSIRKSTNIRGPAGRPFPHSFIFVHGKGKLSNNWEKKRIKKRKKRIKKRKKG